MNQNSKGPPETESAYTPLDLVIDDIIQSIEKVDKELERFYKIHRAELTATDDD